MAHGPTATRPTCTGAGKRHRAALRVPAEVGELGGRRIHRRLHRATDGVARGHHEAGAGLVGLISRRRRWW